MSLLPAGEREGFCGGGQQGPGPALAGPLVGETGLSSLTGAYFLNLK